MLYLLHNLRPMRNLLLLLCCLAGCFGFSQKTPAALKITYIRSSNGNAMENQDPIVVFTDQSQTVITSQKILDKKADYPFEQSVVDRASLLYSQFAQLSKTRSAATLDSTAIGKQVFEETPKTKTILGYPCKMAKTVINSNTIEVWYTDAAGIKGAPSVLGQNLGLVLEVTRNGNFTIAATKVEKLKSIPKPAIPVAQKTKVDLLTYRDLLWKSRFTQIPVFRKETINFSDDFGSNDSILRFAKGTIIVRKIKLPTISKNSRIFIDATEQSAGDAYDRTGSVFLIPTDNKLSFLDGLKETAGSLPVYENGNGKKYQGVVRTGNYSPLLELMRFFTPFGIKQYNTIQLKGKTWQDSVYYRQDVTDLLPVLSDKEIWIGANIANYDKGGHKLSVNITIHPEEESAETDNFVLPLFNTNNVMEMAGQEYATMFDSEKGLELTFTLASAVKGAKLRYITTGHGGWENGDEFLQKTNTILLDGKEMYSFIPWRTDCGSYRMYNPASGNFNNGLSSSDYSRSNWCPGMTTSPVYIPLGDLAAGEHKIQIKIPQGAREGNSFSSWNVSGVLLGR
ncbi:Peptide-N-glycosidase F N-terminal domain-containing protein [Flavobacterium longum]